MSHVGGMTREQALERARHAMGRRCHYVLGMGGRRPHQPLPWSGPPECDCSGFVAWCLGRDRMTPDPWYRSVNGGWIETTAIVRDCASPFGFFSARSWREAEPGDLLVYGDWKDENGKVRQGHVGIVSDVTMTGPQKAIHCSKGNFLRGGDAIAETDVALWAGRKDAVVALYALFSSAAA